MTDLAVQGADALLHVSMQGGAAIMLVWLLLRAMPDVPAALQVWIWRLLFVKIAIGVFIQPPLPYVSDLMSGRTFSTPSDILVLTLVIIWACGVLASVCFLALDFASALRLRRNCRPCDRPDVLAIMAQVTRSGRSHPVQLAISAEIESPLVLGPWRPLILLPAVTVEQATRAELCMMISHELAHIRRRDLLLGWLPALAECLLFFHPLVWLARRELRVAQDSACDALSLTTSRVPPADYARLLVRIAQPSRQAIACGPMALGAMENFHTLRTRLKRLGRRRGTPLLHGPLALLPLLIALVPVRAIVPLEAPLYAAVIVSPVKAEVFAVAVPPAALAAPRSRDAASRRMATRVPQRLRAESHVAQGE